MARVEFLNVDVLVVGVTSSVVFEDKDKISKMATLEGSPVPTTDSIEAELVRLDVRLGEADLIRLKVRLGEADLVRLDVRLGIGDTVTVKTVFDGRTRVEGFDTGRPVPTKVVGTEGVAIWDTSDKLELATLETGSIGKIISRDV